MHDIRVPFNSPSYSIRWPAVAEFEILPVNSRIPIFRGQVLCLLFNMHSTLLDLSAVVMALLLFSSTVRAEEPVVYPQDWWSKVVDLPTEPGKPTPPNLGDHREFLKVPASQGPPGNQYDEFAQCLANVSKHHELCH